MTRFCSRCGQPATKAIATTDFCDTCHHNFLQPLRDKHQPPTLHGTGKPIGPTNGPHTQLQCNQCNATWTGTPNEPCNYCAHQYQYALRWQAELTLTPPDIDPDDINRDNTLNEWGQRLRRAVQAEIITLQQAQHTWSKATQHAPHQPI